MMLLLLLACGGPLPEPTDTAPTAALLEDCSDGVDNDGDDSTDCLDPDCAEAEVCIEVCDDGVDNDQDGRSDCADKDCKDTEVCTEDCGDGVDNDLDGRADCEDSECRGTPLCLEDCSDGVDNDLDTLTDCQDADCFGDPACVEDCFDGVDNDSNGLLDCEDAQCAGICSETSCVDGVDNDLDGETDCEDTECWGRAACGTSVLLELEMADYWGTASYWSFAASSVPERNTHRGHIRGEYGRILQYKSSTVTSCSWTILDWRIKQRSSAYGWTGQAYIDQWRLSPDCSLDPSLLSFSASGADSASEWPFAFDLGMLSWSGQLGEVSWGGTGSSRTMRPSYTLEQQQIWGSYFGLDGLIPTPALQ